MRYNGKGSGDDKNLEGPDTPDGPQLFPNFPLYFPVLLYFLVNPWYFL